MKTKINFSWRCCSLPYLLVRSTFAQGLYVNAGAGYGFPAACYLE